MAQSKWGEPWIENFLHSFAAPAGSDEEAFTRVHAGMTLWLEQDERNKEIARLEARLHELELEGLQEYVNYWHDNEEDNDGEKDEEG